MGLLTEHTHPRAPKGAPNWMVTYGDMMSLLLCFFILLLSFSETDRQKYKQVAGSLEKAFGVQRKTKAMDVPKGMTMIAKDFDQEIIQARIKDELAKEVEEMVASDFDNLSEQISLQEEGEKIVIRLMGESTFDSGSVEIRYQLKPLLENVAKILEKSGGDVVIAGHTDNVPIHTSLMRNNLQLSISRAAAVAEFLLAHSRIDPKRVSTMGFGEYRPIESNEVDSGRQKNRRVEIIVGKMPQPKQDSP